MKTLFKITITTFLVILIILMSMFLYFLIITNDAKIDKNKLIDMDKTITYFDINGEKLFSESNARILTPIDLIPKHVQNAFIAIEDKRFYKHNGIDFKGLSRAMLTNLKSFSFKEGGSTITQQLIKNTHLSNEKTFKRKLVEIRLATKLEKLYSKQEILEIYLNTIYFGDSCYGITKASEHYFNKKPSQLSINEGAILAGIIKAPTLYSPLNDYEKCLNRKNVVLKEMYNEKYITKEEYDKSVNEKINLNKCENENKIYDYFYMAKKEVSSILKNKPYWSKNINIYTNYDKNKQKIINETLSLTDENMNKCAILLNSNGGITAYSSTQPSVIRQVGSIIKPLVSYCPAIEKNLVYSATPLLDEKSNFNGYCPSNYNDNYEGYISVKKSLAKSSNVCAVKLLNYVGIENAREYLQNLGIPLSAEDNNLSLALGSSKNGIPFINLLGAYTIFLNDGTYFSPRFVNKIEDNENRLIYRHNNNGKKIFSEDTITIVNDMLEETVKSGTAKKLSFINVPLCAKTGTVGTNNGNTDAYNLSFNTENLLGVWIGNKSSLLDNKITGGTLPTIISSKIFEQLYLDKVAPLNYKKSDKVVFENIDKIEYEQNKTLILADPVSPNRYVEQAIFKKSHLPTSCSNRFSCPKLENTKISVNNNEISISLCLTEYINAKIFRVENNKKTFVFDTKGKESTEFIDRLAVKGRIYEYIVLPYYEDKNTTYFGKEIRLEKIKTPSTSLDDWWKNDLG